MLWKRPHNMIQTWLMVVGLPRWLTGGPVRWADCCSRFRLLMSCCWFCWFLIIFWNLFQPENVASYLISPPSGEGFNGQHVIVVGLSNNQCIIKKKKVLDSYAYRWSHVEQSTVLHFERKLGPSYLYVQSEDKASVLELVCWGLLSAFLYKAVFWLTCRYRKQRSAAQGMWSFFCPRLW